VYDSIIFLNDCHIDYPNVPLVWNRLRAGSPDDGQPFCRAMPDVRTVRIHMFVPFDTNTTKKAKLTKIINIKYPLIVKSAVLDDGAGYVPL